MIFGVFFFFSFCAPVHTISKQAGFGLSSSADIYYNVRNKK